MKIGGISIYGFGLLLIFAYLWGSFVYYKKSKESHFDEFLVLDTVVVAAFWALLVGRLLFSIFNFNVFWNHFGRVFFLTTYPGIDRWGAIFGICFGVFLSVRKSKTKFFDWYDFVSLGITAGMAVVFGGLSILGLSWKYLIEAIYLTLGFSILWRLEGSYRTISWYRNRKTSAKSGFIGGFILSLWGSVNWLELLLNWKMNWWVFLWGFVLFVGGVVLVYIRSGRTAAEDIKIILRHAKHK